MSLDFKAYTFKENSKSDRTLKDLVSNDKTAAFSILGYPDDEAIGLNGGKLGASKAPNFIRESFYKMTPSKDFKDKSISDLGNLSFKASSIEERHEFASKKVLAELHQKKRIISLGGGHDYAYVDGKAFCESQKKEALVFNFDAHFDLRNLDKGITSGTPFYRLKESYPEKIKLFEIGIQRHCNSDSLYTYAEKNQIETLDYELLFPNNTFCFDYFKKRIEAKTQKDQDCYISIDIDGFSSSFAPGCSQSWPVGFDYPSFEKAFKYLIKRFNVRILGVYEVSPPLDHNLKTTRLASLILYRFMELCEV